MLLIHSQSRLPRYSPFAFFCFFIKFQTVNLKLRLPHVISLANGCKTRNQGGAPWVNPVTIVQSAALPQTARCVLAFVTLDTCCIVSDEAFFVFRWVAPFQVGLVPWNQVPRGRLEAATALQRNRLPWGSLAEAFKTSNPRLEQGKKID